MALVIGRRARRVRPADGWDHVAHLTAANDFGVYDLRYADRGSNVRSKGIDGFTPIGPRLIDARGDRPRSAAPAHLGQRRTGPGRLARAGPAVRLRRHRGRPVPAAHPGTRRRDLDRHAHRLDRGDPRRRGGGRGQRGGPVVRPAAQPDRRGGLPPGPARRHAPRHRRRTRRRLRRHAPPPGARPRSPQRPARGLHRHLVRRTTQARPEHPDPRRPALHPPGTKDGRLRPHGPLPAAARGPVRRATAPA